MSASLSDDSDQVVDARLNCLFAETGDATDGEDLNRRAAAMRDLAEIFLRNRPGKWYYRVEDIRYDSHALRLMLGRFQRDAFGMGRLWSHLERLEQDKQLTEAVRKDIQKRVTALGLRVGSEKPRKTRIAAVFSLWMCTFRPVSIRFMNDPEKDRGTDQFCAALNFWIACTYLRKFGQVVVGSPATRAELMGRILHDFTFRALNHSSLEMLYCSIFRPTDSES